MDWGVVTIDVHYKGAGGGLDRAWHCELQSHLLGIDKVLKVWEERCKNEDEGRKRTEGNVIAGFKQP